MTEKEKQKEKEKQSAQNAILMIIGVVGIIFLIIAVSNSSKDAQRKFEDDWKAQMKKNPATWTKSERDTFQAFMDWNEKQN